MKNLRSWLICECAAPEAAVNNPATQGVLINDFLGQGQPLVKPIGLQLELPHLNFLEDGPLTHLTS